MTVEFGSWNGPRKIIKKDIKTIKEALDTVQGFLDQHHITSYYWRYVGKGFKETIIDYGSHSSFFAIDVDVEDIINYGKTKTEQTV